MIFKTFDSDIDKISAKWGIFGKSFNEIGTAITGRISDINKGFHQATDDLLGAFKDTDSIWKRLYPSKETIQSQLIDVDSVIPKIDSDNFDFDNWINGLNEVDKKVKANKSSWQDFSNSLDDNQKWIAKWGEETQGTIRTQEGLIKANQQARQTALAHNEELKQQTLGYKAATLVTKAFSIALNMLASAAISWVISKAYEAIDNYVHRVEKAKETLSDMESELDSINSKISENKKLIAELEAIENPSITDEEDLERLKAENEELRIRQKYLDMQREEQGKKVAKYAEENYDKKYGNSKYETSRENVDKYKEKLSGSTNKPTLSNNYLTGNASDSENATNTFNTYNDEANALTRLIAEYEFYNEKKKEAVKTGDAKVVEEYNEKIKTLTGELTTARTEIQGYADDMDKAGDSIALASAKSDLDLIDSVLLSNGERFTEFINSEVSANDKDRLIALAEAGKLTADELKTKFSDVNKYLEENGITIEDLISILGVYKEELNGLPETNDSIWSGFTDANSKAIDDFQSKIKTLGDALSSIKSGNMDSSMLIDLQQEFPELQGKSENLEEAIRSLISNALQELYKLLGANLPDNVKNSLQAIADEAIGTVPSLDKAFSAIQKSYDVLENFKKAMSTGMTDEVLSSVASLSGELNDLVAGFYAGVVSSDKLFQALTDHYNIDLKNYASAMIAKNQYSEQFYNSVGLNSAKVVDSFANNYGVDISNCKNYNEAKIQIEKQTLQTVSSMWSKYYNAQSQSFTNEFKSLARIGNQKKSSGVSYDNNAELQLANQIASQVKNYNNAMKALENITYNGIGANFKKISGDIGKVSSGSSSSSKETSETFNWIEKAIQKVQRTITNLGKTVSSTYKTWTTRNNALKDQISAINQEISLQQQAYNKYMALADSTGLSSYYKNLVQNGAIQYETITNESLIDQIKQYEEFYKQALECQDAIIDLKDELASLAETKFDNVSKEYDNQLSLIENRTNMLNNSIDILESKGYMASAKIYDSLVNAEMENLSMLQSKYESLNNTLNTSGIEKGTEAWYDMYLEVLDVKEQIQESEKAIIKFNNSLRDLDWEVFDTLQERISSITSESEFLINLMSDEKMFSENGSITKHGQATLGLHAVNYNTYLAQSDEYAKEIQQINDELSKDPYNQDLLKRRDKLLEQQRDMILSAEDEKQAIVDLRKEGYDTLLSYMDKVISKRKDMLNQIKDLYDYEKNVAEQTKDIASLEKQLSAYQGDDSEEARSTIQKIKVSLEEAKQNLEETQYDKFISDQEKMLDTLRDDAAEWGNTHFENIDTVIRESIASANENTELIKETLESETNAVGTAISDKMESIWSTNGTFTTIVSDYSNGFTNQLTTVNGTLSTIKDYIAGMVNKSNTEANKQQEQISKPSTSNTGGSSNNTSTSKPSSSSNSSASSNGWQSALIPKKDSYPKSKLNKDNSIVDLLKFHNFDSAFSVRANLYRAMNGSGVYTGSSSQNRFMIKTMKSAGYKKGSPYIPYDQMNWIHEGEILHRASDGGLLVPLGSGDKVFTKEMSDNLWNMAQMNFVPKVTLPIMPSVQSKGNNNDIRIDIGDIKMYGVNDPETFAKQLKDNMLNNSSIRRIMKDTTIGEALGKNTMIRFTR